MPETKENLDKEKLLAALEAILPTPGKIKAVFLVMDVAESLNSNICYACCAGNQANFYGPILIGVEMLLDQLKIISRAEGGGRGQA